MSSLKGINGTIFMYGQTGAGKTFTMLGDKAQLVDQPYQPQEPLVSKSPVPRASKSPQIQQQKSPLTNNAARRTSAMF